MSERDVAKEIKRLEKLMMEYARNLEFENAARVRDQLATLREQAFGVIAANDYKWFDLFAFNSHYWMALRRAWITTGSVQS